MQNRSLTQVFHSKAGLAVGGLLLWSLVLVTYAFVAAGDGLAPDQRWIIGWVFAVLAGTAGYFFDGVLLKVSGQLGPTVAFAIRALNGAALFLIVFFVLGASGENKNAELAPPSEKGPVVTYPRNGGEVGPTEIVRGHTPHPGWSHYLQVGNSESGGTITQLNAIDASPNGDLSTSATFGSAGAGVGEHYSIQFIDSKASLDRRGIVLNHEGTPSPAIVVTRGY